MPLQQPKFTKQMLQNAVQRGLHVQAMANEWNCTVGLVYIRAAKWGMRVHSDRVQQLMAQGQRTRLPGRRRADHVADATLRAAVARGLTRAELMQELNLGKATLHRRLRRLKLEPKHGYRLDSTWADDAKCLLARTLVPLVQAGQCSMQAAILELGCSGRSLRTFAKREMNIVLGDLRAMHRSRLARRRQQYAQAVQSELASGITTPAHVLEGDIRYCVGEPIYGEAPVSVLRGGADPLLKKLRKVHVLPRDEVYPGSCMRCGTCAHCRSTNVRPNSARHPRHLHAVAQ